MRIFERGTPLILRLLTILFLISSSLTVTMGEIENGKTGNCSREVETFFFENSSKKIIEYIKNLLFFSDNIQQNYFEILPVEIIEHIFSFLFHEETENNYCLLSFFFKKKDCAETSEKPTIKKLKSILKNKNILNASLVNKSWHELITSQVNRNLSKIYKKAQQKLESEFTRISQNRLTSKDDLNTFKCLLKLGMNINIEWSNYSMLNQAIKANNQAITNIIFDYLAKCNKSTQKKIITAKNESNNTALILAISRQQADVIKRLFRFISSMDKAQQFAIFSWKNNLGRTALFETICLNRGKIIKLVWSFLEKFDQANQIKLINTKDVYGNTIIMWAATWGSKKIMKQTLAFMNFSTKVCRLQTFCSIFKKLYNFDKH